MYMAVHVVLSPMTVSDENAKDPLQRCTFTPLLNYLLLALRTLGRRLFLFFLISASRLLVIVLLLFSSGGGGVSSDKGK